MAYFNNFAGRISSNYLHGPLFMVFLHKFTSYLNVHMGHLETCTVTVIYLGLWMVVLGISRRDMTPSSLFFSACMSPPWFLGSFASFSTGSSKSSFLLFQRKDHSMFAAGFIFVVTPLHWRAGVSLLPVFQSALFLFPTWFLFSPLHINSPLEPSVYPS